MRHSGSSCTPNRCSMLAPSLFALDVPCRAGGRGRGARAFKKHDGRGAQAVGEGQPQGAWPQRRGGGGRLLDVEEGRAGVVGEGRGGVEGEACGGCCVVKSPCLLPPGPLIRLGGLLFSAPWTCPSHHPSCPLTLPPPPSSQVEKPKQKEKWRFLQKYWHKGAFFQVGLVAVVGEQAGRGVASSSMQHALSRTWGRFNRVSALPRARTHHPLASPHMGDADDERAQTDQLAASCRTSPNHAPHSPHPHPHPDLTSDLTWHLLGAGGCGRRARHHGQGRNL